MFLGVSVGGAAGRTAAFSDLYGLRHLKRCAVCGLRRCAALASTRSPTRSYIALICYRLLLSLRCPAWLDAPALAGAVPGP
jgi:hypothetical protein